MEILKVRNKNAIKELLYDDISFEKISVVNHLDQDSLTKEILLIAKKRDIRIELIPIKNMIKRRSGISKEVLVAFIRIKTNWTLNNVLTNIYKENKIPFFVLINRIDFESNIGIISRTSFAAGVNGIIFQGNQQNFLNDETLHFSMGAIARIPLIKMNIFEAIKELKENGIKTFCIKMDAITYYKEDMTGPAAFILGAEARGMSNKISSRCDKSLSIPMESGINSLNVSITAGIILYEKIKQDKKKKN